MRHSPTAVRLLLLLFALAFCRHAVAVPPGQPYAGLWHLKSTDPNYILNYNILSDPDAPYRRAGTPLAARGRNANFKLNANARAGEAGVTALSTFHAANNNPVQGERTDNFLDYYVFVNWQYIDQLVMWGGSAGKGIILAPNPTIIDAAHRNGVPVLGNIFFPPATYGGKIEWVQALVQKQGDKYPAADKLIEIATYCGFDGWFVNQETEGGDTALATQVRDFLKYLKANSTLRIMWYDAMTESGAVGWQNTLNSNNDAFFQDGGTTVSDTFFADFGWGATAVTNGAATASALGRSPYDVYFGLNVSAAGTGTSLDWSYLFPDGAAHRASLGLFQPNWTYTKSGNDSTLFYQREREFWSGPNQDPSKTPGTTNTTDWEGVAHYVQEWSVVRQFPFVTSFNLGHGNRFYRKGVMVRKATDAAGKVFNWHNLTTQDVLPSWQWTMQTTSATPLTPAWYWTDSYNGGNCLRVSGKLDAVNELKLFQTRLNIDATTSLRLVYKDTDGQAATNMKLALGFNDAPGTIEYLDIGTRDGTGWSTKTLSLSAFAGRTLGYIGVQFDPTATGTVNSYSMQLGELAIYNGTLPTPSPPTDVRVENEYSVSATRKAIRVRWTPSVSNNIRYYNIYRRNSDGTRTWLWAGGNEACFAPELDRDGTETSAVIEVEAVNNAMEASAAATTTLAWNEPPTISAVASLTIPENGSTGALSFTVSDGVTPASDLQVTATSGTPGLVPPGGTVLGGSGANRTVTVTPNAGAAGVATITLTVADAGGMTASTSFVVTVSPAEGLAGVLARWPMDNSLGDASGNGWDLSGNGTIAYSTNSKRGPASWQLDGATNSASTDVPLPVGDAFSIAAWIYVPSGTTQIQTIAANSVGGNATDGFRFYVNTYNTNNTADGKLIFVTGNGTNSSTVSSAAGAVAFDSWQHVCAAVDRAAGNAKLYLNGTNVASASTLSDFANEALFHLGAMSSQFRFRSLLDDVRLYNRALTQEEVKRAAYGNSAPTVSAVPDQVVTAGGSTPSIAFMVGDAESAATNLLVTVAASDPALVPSGSAVLGGSGAARTLVITPAAGRTGSSTITLNVSDGVANSSTWFNLTVLPAESLGGLLARWPFDGSLGDASGHGNDVTVTGNASYAVPRAQGTASLALDGVSNSVATLSALNLGDAFTVSAWFYVPSGTTNIQTIAANSAGGNSTDGFRFYVNTFNTGDGKLILVTGNGTTSKTVSSTNGVVSFDRWNHAAASINRAGGTATLYLNGAAVASNSILNNFTNSAVLYLGAMNTQFRLRSNLDDVRVYGQALAASNIVVAMDAGRPPLTAWQQQHFGYGWDSSAAAGDRADPDGDGVCNFLEYALSGNPWQASAADSPRYGIVGSALSLEFKRVIGQRDIDMAVQGAYELAGPWVDLAVSTKGGAFTNVVQGALVTETNAGTVQNVRVVDPQPMGDPAVRRRFLRLKVGQ